MANECFERELRQSLYDNPELHYFDMDDFKDCFKKSKIEIWTQPKDFDCLLTFEDPDTKEMQKMFVDLYGYPEAGHCTYFPKKDYDFRLEGTDEELYTQILPQRREHILKNLAPDFGYLEVFTLGDLVNQIRRVWDGLEYPYTEAQLADEFAALKRKDGDPTTIPTHNKIVRIFQPHIIHNEQTLYKNFIERRRLIQNRMKFRFKAEYELSDVELIMGCKISKACPTYSMFDPLWFKYFIYKYHPKKIYDPFGGWGHRALAAMVSDVEKYIYNDLDPRTCEGVSQMAEYFRAKNIEVHNGDAKEFRPAEDFDAVFTCPPYDNTEIYSQEIEDFDSLLRGACEPAKGKLTGIVIRENFEPLLKDIFGAEPIEKTIMNKTKSHFGKNNFEYLYIFKP